jgi:hypothetical protein
VDISTSRHAFWPDQDGAWTVVLAQSAQVMVVERSKQLVSDVGSGHFNGPLAALQRSKFLTFLLGKLGQV